tara:strand:- start:1444 stop:2076 length:633 start_codon:yes stop_codon:yes gene_type:complete
MYEQDRQWLLVGYFPQTSRRLTPGTKLLLDPVMSAAFEVAIESAGIIDPEILGRHLNSSASTLGQFHESRCRAQIKVQAGVTDVHTAEALAQFYMDIENRRWEAVSDVLIRDLDFWVPRKLFQEHPKAQRKEIFLQQLKKWSYRYDETYFDIQWANISTDHAMVRMNVVCQGEIIVEALSEYRFDLIDDEIKLVSIFNHSLKSLALPILT